jgi:ElaB/YqjD/DUF883 family membrane-anchored ribosome-binding protein
MQPNPLNNLSATGSQTGPGGSEGKIGQTAGSAHSALDSAVSSANSAIDDMADKVKPMIGRVAESAHHAVDKAAGMAEVPAEWLGRKGEDLKQTQEKALTDARDYVMANPLKAVGIALVAGVLIGRIMR